MSFSNPPDFASDWSDYWSHGALTSLPQDFSSNYDGEIADFWQAQCSELSEGARVLDLCSGNGAIALLVAGFAANYERRWRIDAVDAARLDADTVAATWPGLSSLLADITFHGGQRAETFAAEAASYDLIVSQYGAEYCQWAALARQVMHLLKPGGRLAMINHAPDSAMLATMRAEADDYDALDHSGALGEIEGWLQGNLSLANLRIRLERPERVLEQRLKRRATPLVEQAWQSVAALRRAPAPEIEGRRDDLSAWLGQLQAGAGRLRNMLEVNEAIADNPGWADVFIDAGLEPVSDSEIVYRGRHRVGRGRAFVKPSEAG